MPTTTSRDQTIIDAWGQFIMAQGALMKRVDRALAEAGLVTSETYDLLLILEDAPDSKLRMCELADLANLSRSGITRAVDRLEKQGYLKRQACPNDRRSLYAVLTEEGRAAREAAWPVYRTTILETFGKAMDADEARVLAKALARARELA